MFFRRKKRGQVIEDKAHGSAGSDRGASSKASASKSSPTPKVSVRQTSGDDKPIHRQFPGPRQAEAILRVAVDRSAHAELIAHAKASLEAEVCGVLAGHICEDDEGIFVHVEAVIRGAAATQGSTHVTFTQATWNSIHQTLEREYPKLRMIGWYHTHPGFGVEFSEMDLFIQRNFFSGPTQIALVTDPLNGAVAICVNTAQGIEYVSRFWVDGREQSCRVPERKSERSPASLAGPDEPEATRSLQTLESKVNQLLQAVDEQRASYHRFLLFMGMIFCLAVVVGIGYFIFHLYVNRNEPPKLNSFAPVPVQIGDKVVLLGVGVVEWQVPPELDALYLKMEKLKKEEAEKAAKEAAAKAGKKSANSPADAAKTNTSPQTTNELK